MALPGWPRSIIAWKSRRQCAQHHCKRLIHQYDFSRSQVATLAYVLPSSFWAIWAVRSWAMWNNAAQGVTAAHQYETVAKKLGLDAWVSQENQGFPATWPFRRFSQSAGFTGAAETLQTLSVPA